MGVSTAQKSSSSSHYDAMLGGIDDPIHEVDELDEDIEKEVEALWENHRLQMKEMRYELEEVEGVSVSTTSTSSYIPSLTIGSMSGASHRRDNGGIESKSSLSSRSEQENPPTIEEILKSRNKGNTPRSAR